MKNCYHKINKNKIANIYYDWCIDTITDSLSGVATLLLIFLSREHWLLPRLFVVFQPCNNSLAG